MKQIVFAALLCLTMVACAQMPSPPPNDTTDHATLGMYYWDLADARNSWEEKIEAFFVPTKKPVRLLFGENRFFVTNTCNNISGSCTIKEDRITFGQAMSTMMHCADDRMNLLDQLVREMLQGDFTIFLSTSPSDDPVLVLKKSSGESLSFTGVPTPETRYGSAGETIFLEVAAKREACSHPLNPTFSCLQFREVYYDAGGIQIGNSGAFENLYQPIEGYQHEEGVRNILRVKRYKVKNPPADASDIAYVLDMVVVSEIINK